MEKAKRILKNHKLRVTPGRVSLLEMFLTSSVALSNQDIEGKFPEMDRITMYRTIKSFQEKGIIHKAFDGTGVSRYASCSEHCNEHAHHDEHVHFHCTHCDNTFCVDHIKVPSLDMPSGFAVSKTNVVVEGVCGKCT